MLSPFNDTALLGEEFNPKTYLLQGISIDYMLFSDLGFSAVPPTSQFRSKI
jgi:hypothetical protein